MSKYYINIIIICKIALICLFFLKTTNVHAQTIAIKFQYSTLEKVFEKAQREGKFIFIDVYAPYCQPCKMMEKGVFVNKDIALYYNEHFISFKMNMENKINHDFQAKYEIFDLPTLLYFDADGSLIQRATGGHNSSSFLKLGKEVVNEVKSENNAILAQKLDSPFFREPPKSMPKKKKSKSRSKSKPKSRSKSKPKPIPPPKSNPIPIQPSVLTAPPPPTQGQGDFLTNEDYLPENERMQPTPPIREEGSQHNPYSTKSPPAYKNNIITRTNKALKSTKLRRENRVLTPDQPLDEIQPMISPAADPASKKERDFKKFAGLIQEYNAGNFTPPLLEECAYLAKKYYRPYNTIVNQYLDIQYNNLQSIKVRKFLYDFSINLENNVIDYFLHDIAHFKKQYGSKLINERIQDAIYNSVLVAIKERDQRLFDKCLAVAQTAELPNNEDFLFEISSTYYQGIEDWESYAKLIMYHFGSREITDPQLLSDAAWKFHQYVHGDKKMLKKSLRWIEQSLQIESEYYNNHIYASLLYKIGDIGGATKACDDAIRIAKLRNIDFEPTSSLLNRIQGHW